MYPRNAASPPRIAIGAVVQISDGAVQSSGVSVVVRAEGGSETSGGGTVSYGGSSSVVYYAPTQAETDYTAFVVTAYKSGCIPVSVTVITTASATSGQVVVGSNNDKTGYSLASGPLDAAGVRSAIGLTSANLDTQLADLPTVSEFEARSLPSADYFVVGDYTAPANSDIAAILADTNELQTNQGNWLTATGFSTHSASDVVTALGTGSTLSAIPWNAAWDTEVQSECADALAAYDPPTKAELDSAVSPLATSSALSTVAGYLDTEIAAILENTGTTIPAQIAALNNVSAAQVVTAMGTGTFLTAIPWNASWDAEVQSECTDALNAYDPPTRSEATSDKAEVITELEKVPRAGAGSFTHTRTGGSTGVDEVTISVTE